ncbi:MAG: hypothetical protein II943_00910 [Victivallales bacterium]|nr:hypothetical protein [Victivallales bacterium]
MFHPQQEIVLPFKASPKPPSLIPWEELHEDQQPPFMHPDINTKIRNPFLVSFVLPPPPGPQTAQVASSPVEEPPAPPPPPPHTCEITYTGIYHSLMGKTIAYLKCVDSLSGELTVNLSQGEEIVPGLKIQEITEDAVLITSPSSAEVDGKSLLRLPLRESITLTLPRAEETSAE